MESGNPYQAPRADLEADPSTSTYDTSPVYSPRGRFGRLSYLAWALLLGLGNGAVQSLLLTFFPNPEDQASLGAIALLVAFGLPFFVLGVIFNIRRLHDINFGAWWLLIGLVPLLNLLFFLAMMFWPGTAGSNNYGAPRLTRAWEKLLGWLTPLFILVALTAAVAIPFYQAFIEQTGSAGG